MRSAYAFLATLLFIIVSPTTADSASLGRQNLKFPGLLHRVVVGGHVETDADRKRAIVHLKQRNGKSWYGCTATFIAPSVLLTAAHCLRYNSNRFQIKSGGRVWKFASYLMHPKYKYYKATDEDLATTENDIGLVFLNKTNKNSESIFGIISNKTPISHGYFDGFISGYGMTGKEKIKTTGTLRTAELEIEGDGEQGFMWAYGEVNACQGDSGGPAYIERGGKFIVVGVGSLANCEDRGAYLRVSDYSDWIIREVRSRGYEIGDPVHLPGEGVEAASVAAHQPTREAVDKPVEDTGPPTNVYSSPTVMFPLEYPGVHAYASKEICLRAGYSWNRSEQARCKQLKAYAAMQCNSNRNDVWKSWTDQCEKLVEQIASDGAGSTSNLRDDGLPSPDSYSSKADCAVDAQARLRSEFHAPTCSKSTACKSQMEAMEARWNKLCDEVAP